MPSCHETEYPPNQTRLLYSGLAGEIQQIAQGLTLARETVETEARASAPGGYEQYVAPALHDMDLCVRYLCYIAENLTDLSLHSRGQLIPRLEPVEPAWQWGRLARLVSRSAGSGRVEWASSCPEGQFVLADEAWTDKIFLHLLLNALRYAEGPVKAVLRPARGGLELTVCDTGPGLPEDALSRPEAAGGRHGVGLGLFLARQYALAMDWEFSVESGCEGTRVRLYAPARLPGATGALHSASRDLAVCARQDERLRTMASALSV